MKKQNKKLQEIIVKIIYLFSKLPIKTDITRIEDFIKNKHKNKLNKFNKK